MTLKFLVAGQKLTYIANTQIIADTINYIGCDFNFQTEDWEGLSKWVHFAKDGVETYNPINLDENDSIPDTYGLDLTEGSWEMWVHGNILAGETEVRRITTNTINFLVAPYSGIEGGSVLPSIDPTVAEQIDGKATRAEKAKIASASASIDSGIGTPSVDVAIGGEDYAHVLEFAFHNLKGIGISGIVFAQDGTLTVNKDDGTSTTFNGIKAAIDSITAVENNVEAAEALRVIAEAARVVAETGRVNAENLRDANEIKTVTSTVDANVGTPSVDVTKAGNNLALDFHNLKGQAATVSAGTTTTGAPGTSASVTNSGTTHAAVFDFVIPRGEKGETGSSGVYVGTTAPTDPSINVWIDPQGTEYLNAGDVGYSASATYPNDSIGKRMQEIDISVVDVKVDGESVVDPVTHIAEIETPDIPTRVSELLNDSGYQTAANVSSAIITALVPYAKTADVASTYATQVSVAEAIADAHTHDNKSELDLIESGDVAKWDAKYNKPATGIPKTDLASAVQTSLDKADTALQEHQSLASYRTSADQDIIDALLQPKTDNTLSTVAKTIVGAINELVTALAGKVANTVKVNGHALSSDVTVLETDIAHGETTVGAELTAQSSQIESLNTTVGQHTTAIANKSDKASSFTLTLDADDWDDTENTLTITDARFVVDGFDYVVTPTSASYKTYGESQICAYDVTVASEMTFHAETIPEDDLTVNIMKVVSA